MFESMIKEESIGKSLRSSLIFKLLLSPFSVPQFPDLNPPWNCKCFSDSDSKYEAQDNSLILKIL